MGERISIVCVCVCLCFTAQISDISTVEMSSDESYPFRESSHFSAEPLWARYLTCVVVTTEKRQTEWTGGLWMNPCGHNSPVAPHAAWKNALCWFSQHASVSRVLSCSLNKNMAAVCLQVCDDITKTTWTLLWANRMHIGCLNMSWVWEQRRRIQIKSIITDPL